MIAAGTESMSVMPQIMGNKSLNPAVFAKQENSASPSAWASPPRRWPSNGR